MGVTRKVAFKFTNVDQMQYAVTKLNNRFYSHLQVHGIINMGSSYSPFI